MNKKKLAPLLFVILLIAFALIHNNWSKQPSYVHPKGVDISTIPDNDSEEGEEDPMSENPIERLEFEIGQLVDPSTGEIPRNIKQKELVYAKKHLLPLQKESNRYGVNPNSLNNESGAKSLAAETFVNMGPFNVGGRTRAIEIDVNDEDILLAGGVSGGVWKSIDQGQSWTRTSGLQDHPSVTSIVQDQRTGKTSEWYYSTGEFSGNSASDRGAFYYGNGIYKSTDNGDSWQLITSTAQPGTSGTDVIRTTQRFTIIDELTIDYSEANGTEIYASGLSEIIRSTDGFQTFEVVLGADNGGNNFTDVAITSTGKVFAVIANSSFNGSNAEDGIFMSDDGITWTSIEPTTNFPSSFSRMEIAIDPNNENRVYFVGSDRLFLFDDATDTWTDLSTNLGTSTEDLGTGHNIQGGYDLYAAVHPGNSDVVFIGGVNLLRSSDGFQSAGGRKQIGGYNNDNNPNSFPRYPNHHPDNHDYAFLPSNPDVMFSGSDGGVHVTQNNQANVTTTNPVAWQSLNNGYTTTQFYHASIHLYDLADNQLIGGMQDNGSWGKFNASPQENWTEISSGDGSYSAITYNSLYTSSQRGNIRRFVLNNDTYEFEGNITPSSTDSDFLFINPYIVNPVNQDQMFVGALGRVFFTNNVRNTPGEGEWEEITSSAMNNQNVSALAMSVQGEGRLYFGTRNGKLFKVEDTRNLENNTAPVAITTAALPSGGNVSGLAVDPSDADKVIATYSNYGVISVWYTENGGATWNSISGNLEENSNGSGAGPSIRSVAIMPDGNGGNYYFVGTSVGLYMTQTLDGDNTVWAQQAAQSIGNVVVTSLMVRPIDGKVMAATHGNGVFLGSYNVGIVPNINYSFDEVNNTYTLRGNRSFDANSGIAYQWFRNGVQIDGETSSELTVADGGDYQLKIQVNGRSGAGESNIVSINLDGQGPSIASVARFNPITQDTDATLVTFQVTFDEDVIDVSIDDFEVTGETFAVVNSVAIVTDASVFNVEVEILGGSGTLGLGVRSTNNITDTSGNAFTGNIDSQETYNVTDLTPPTVAISRQSPFFSPTDQNSVTFLLVFSEDVTNVDASDFELANAVAQAEVSDVSVVFLNNQYTVTVSQIIEDGEIDLNFSSTQDITDDAGNAFEGTITLEETFIIENVIAGMEGLSADDAKIVVDTNPSDGVFRLVLPSSFSGVVEFNLINSSGKSVHSGSVEAYVQGEELELDLSGEADGLYIFEAVNDSKRATVKLLKRSR